MPRLKVDKKIKPQLVPIPTEAIFTRGVLRRGFYLGLIQDMIADPSKCISLDIKDESAINQITRQSKRLGIKLLKAHLGDLVYFKAMSLSEVRKEILKALNPTSKTINELRTLRLQCDLDAELKYLSANGLCKLSPQSKWCLTTEGKEESER